MWYELTERLALSGAFAAAAMRYWLTVFPQVCVRLRRLRARAKQIADPTLRNLALGALAKRSNIEGAAAFATLAPLRWRAAATDALVAFQALYNHADALAEQPSGDPVETALRLHGALLDALGSGLLDRRDGYTDQLIADCRRALSRLPSYHVVAARAREDAERIVVYQSLGVAGDAEGLAQLETWARAQTPPGSDLCWWETAGACGSSLPVLALLAESAHRRVDRVDVLAVEDAYFPWVAALHSMLDSLLDAEEDAHTEQLSLLACYPTPALAGERLARMAQRARVKARGLGGHRHQVLLAGMAASYLHELRGAEPLQSALALRVRGEIGPTVCPALLVFALRNA